MQIGERHDGRTPESLRHETTRLLFGNFLEKALEVTRLPSRRARIKAALLAADVTRLEIGGTLRDDDIEQMWRIVALVRTGIETWASQDVNRGGS